MDEIEKIRICVADDNEYISKSLGRMLSSNPKLYVAKICKNGKEVIETINNQEIDVLLVDIIMPYLDGIGVLEKLDEEYKCGIISKKPIIILISAIVHDNLKFNIFDLGVNYYMHKPLQYEILEQRIIELYEGDETRHKLEIKKQVAQKLHELEIFPNLNGYKYIEQSIEMLIENNLQQRNFRKDIYSKFVDEEKIPMYKIEKAINNAIVTSWNKDREKLLELFPAKVYEKKNPSARVFLTTIAEEIINNEKEKQGEVS